MEGKLALHWKSLTGNSIQCRLCARFCVIGAGERGFCQVRENSRGKLFSLSYGKARGVSIDPIEKKPFFHFRPSTACLSFGTPGCNFTCKGCQNWELSQEPRLKKSPAGGNPISPKEIVSLAKGTDGIAYTYSEPTIFYEYARDCAKLAKREGLYNVLVSNGFFSREVAEEIAKERLFDAVRIDYKFPDEGNYRKYCQGRERPVLENLKILSDKGIHVEAIVLVISGLNDSEKSLRKSAKKLASIDAELPVHFSRFHPDYSFKGMTTPKETLLLAKKIALEEGLKHVYLGNAQEIPGGEDTFCSGCGKSLIRREGFFVSEILLKKGGICPDCGKRLRGVF